MRRRQMRVETEQTGASRDKRTDVAMEERIAGGTAECPQSGEARSDFTVAIVEMFSASRILLLLMILILAGMALPEESLAQKRWDEITDPETNSYEMADREGFDRSHS